MKNIRKKDFEYTNEELAEIAIKNDDFSSPAFQWYTNDFLASNRVSMMPTEAVGAYVILLNVAWNEKDCGIPTKEDDLVRLSKVLSKENWEKIREYVLKMFFEYNGRYFNRRLLLERKKQINMRNQRKKAINKRYNPTKSLRDTYEKPTKEQRDTLRKVDEDVDEDEVINRGGGAGGGDENLVPYWDSVFGTRVNLIEQEFITELIDRFGKEKAKRDRKSTRLNSSHIPLSRMPSSA